MSFFQDRLNEVSGAAPEMWSKVKEQSDEVAECAKADVQYAFSVYGDNIPDYLCDMQSDWRVGGVTEGPEDPIAIDILSKVYKETWQKALIDLTWKTN